MVNFQKWATIAWTTLYQLPIDDMFLVISDLSLYFVLAKDGLPGQTRSLL